MRTTSISFFTLMGIFFGIITFCAVSLKAQPPFTCEGDFYLVLALNNANSTVYEVVVDPFSGNVVFDPQGNGNSGELLNAIGYRSTDNFIYGVNPNNYDLFRIDANGNANYLTTLPLQSPLTYVAGDVTPDGAALILLIGASVASNSDEHIARVDLNSPNFDVTFIPVTSQSTGGASAAIGARNVDIAFDPTSGICYGYQIGTRKLVTIDVNTGLIDDTAFLQTLNADIMGAMFFDAFGQLYGYGRVLGDTQQNTLFSINKQNGVASILTTGPPATGVDGCSCPFTVQLQKTVSPEVSNSCGTVEYSFLFANSSGQTQSNLLFTDQLPNEFTFTSIIANPLQGDLIGIGTDQLRIENLTLPIGVDTLVVEVTLTGVGNGIYGNQATITQLPDELGNTVLSDNPSTAATLDSTFLTVEGISTNFITVDTIVICPGDSVLMMVDETDLLSIEWNDGSTETSILITESGLYWAEAFDFCLNRFADTLVVVETPSIGLILSGQEELILGETLDLDAFVSTPLDVQYQWLPIPLSCSDCPNVDFLPLEDGWYHLEVVDEFGCTDADSLFVELDKIREVFIPNAFTPNFDGINDVLYPFANLGVAEVRYFKIYNRWGGLVFDATSFPPNSSAYGWDGTFRGEVLNPGVFVYFAEVEYLDGHVEVYSGDVVLLK